ncbi:amino acid permease-domain-containing protein [Podospora didyma]|uniref:Amino acid permease-domain-containing protein n=1 Tax=Podospora didyma TaxID=330526 RepID=A0AAE0NYE2_9PEZI|nr:amino acid permease-domain-containing protein [Podospora didyma]
MAQNDGVFDEGFDPQTPTPAAEPRRTLLDELDESTTDPNKIVNKAPKEQFRLNYLDVGCLVINRMIGTGIFNSPQTVMIGTNSTGMSLIFWVFGLFYAMAGAHVYVEYGLNVPRYIIDGVEQSVPRSGGDLNYLQYIFPRPRYRKDTVLLIGCLYGISFICVGNMAGNCIICALRILQAAHPERDGDFSNGEVRGIALGIAVFACFIHAFSRRGGIWLNNVLALIKIGILLLIIVATCAVAGQAFHRADTGAAVVNEWGDNTSRATAFGQASDEANGYGQAFLAIIFAFSGFEQPNYVLGEIKRPRKTFPIAMFTSVAIVSLFYVAVNICYMVVVPAELQTDQKSGSVAQQFFKMTFGALSNNEGVTGLRVFNAFLAISSFGNIVVMTYTAARMKQEIAKQGFLPWPKFFAQNKDVSLGRLLQWLQHRRGLKFLRFLSPEQHKERTPVGALVLHMGSCIVLIFVTYSLSAGDAYSLLAGMGAYLINSIFGFLLAAGVLLLRVRGPPLSDEVSTQHHPAVQTKQPPVTSWKAMTKGTVRPWLSITSAIIYLIGNGYCVVTNWVPPVGKFLSSKTIAWYLTPMISWCIFLVGSVWYLGFLVRVNRRRRNKKEEFVYERSLEFDWAEYTTGSKDDGSSGSGEQGGVTGGKKSGGLILLHETIYRAWRGTEMKVLGGSEAHHQMNGNENGDLDTASVAVAQTPMDEFAGTDFGNVGFNTSGVYGR